MVGRRGFLRASAAASAGALCFVRKSPLAWAAESGGVDTRIEVLAGEPLGTISPNIYGHFCEHLGGLVYDGVWVGEGSKIANVNGIRKALVDELRKIKPAVIRWPGGCFADSYDWRDGIGAPDTRPRRTDFWADTQPAQNRPAT